MASKTSERKAPRRRVKERVVLLKADGGCAVAPRRPITNINIFIQRPPFHIFLFVNPRTSRRTNAWGSSQENDDLSHTPAAFFDGWQFTPHETKLARPGRHGTDSRQLPGTAFLDPDMRAVTYNTCIVAASMRYWVISELLIGLDPGPGWTGYLRTPVVPWHCPGNSTTDVGDWQGLASLNLDHDYQIVIPNLIWMARESKVEGKPISVKSYGFEF
ncbi:hypothetical protein ARMGADRAFT_1036304 [Armillaria gallica]|uniref:Uncharacterized protein n=1 Tax=Armillaria gallica TaxID=47427 RepID=A0A2H3DBB0_ARMGA|nr:hypothetical protein ARMGADRAFT_1036304 [Armillaria gallica]